jgi:hypothetical protein
MRRPATTFANVTSLVALAVALSGTAYAAIKIPANSVGTAQLKNGAVTNGKVKAGSLRASAFAPGVLPPGAVAYTTSVIGTSTISGPGELSVTGFSVPAGSYTLAAHVAGATDRSASMQCSLHAGGGLVDRGSASVSTVLTAVPTDLTLTGAASVTGPAELTLDCQLLTGSSMSITGVRLTAVRVASLTVK